MTDHSNANGHEDRRQVIRAIWQGGADILPAGAFVEVLASDPGGRMTRDGTEEVSARTAAWVRYWPERSDYPRYRSCDLADLELSHEDFDRLTRCDATETPA